MDTRLAKRNYNIQQWKTIIQDRMISFVSSLKKNGTSSAV